MPQNKCYIVRQREVLVTVKRVWAQDEQDAIALVRDNFDGEVQDQEYEPLSDGLDEWEVEEAPVE